MNVIYFNTTDIGIIGIAKNGRGITNLYLPEEDTP